MSNSIIDNQLDYMRPKPIVLTKEDRMLCYLRQIKILLRNTLEFLKSSHTTHTKHSEH